jgi:enoyl-CoA hydratase/carnithine racemase
MEEYALMEMNFSYTSATPRLEDYKKKFSEVLMLERKNGILEARMHTDNGPFKWSPQAHHMLLEAWATIGLDPDNEVLILTSTDPYWIHEFDKESFKVWDAVTDPNLRFNGLYRPLKSVENFIWGIDIPTIGAINGPGSVHFNFGLLCDVTICSSDFVFADEHFRGGHIPGDSGCLLLQGLIGSKRSAGIMYNLTKSIDAKAALELGIVNEVLPKEQVLARAHEWAELIIKQPRPIRRMTHQLVVRPLKKLFTEDFTFHVTSEMYGFALEKSQHDFDLVKKAWNEKQGK